jgi:phage baseplate assembly protein gpV
MSEQPVKGTRKLSTPNSLVNAISFAIEQAIKSQVNTAELMSIGKADQNGTGGPGGYSSATPLVSQTDGFDNALPAAALSKLILYRPQAGKAAIIMDPQPGDKALAVTMKRDTSGVGVGTKETTPPASFRSFDQADSVLFTGVLGEAPEIWLELNPVSGNISLSTKAANIEISCRESGDIEIKTLAGNIAVKTDAGDIAINAAGGNVTVDAIAQVTVTCPQTVIDGNLRITGGLELWGEAAGQGGGPAIFSRGIINRAGDIVNQGGDVKSSGDVKSGSVTLNGHTHSGVEPGGGNSQAPNRGT